MVLPLDFSLVVVDDLVLLLELLFCLLDLRLEVVVGLPFLVFALLEQLAHFGVEVRVLLFEFVVLGGQVGQDTLEILLLQVVHLAFQVFDLHNLLLGGVFAQPRGQLPFLVMKHQLYFKLNQIY